jgi:hypothetical protein
VLIAQRSNRVVPLLVRHDKEYVRLICHFASLSQPVIPQEKTSLKPRWRSRLHVEYRTVGPMAARVAPRCRRWLWARGVAFIGAGRLGGDGLHAADPATAAPGRALPLLPFPARVNRAGRSLPGPGPVGPPRYSSDCNVSSASAAISATSGFESSSSGLSASSARRSPV